MKLYAQHGAMAGEKVFEGLQRELVDGVIFSPRDITLENLQRQLGRVRDEYPDADCLFDPQYYSCLVASSDRARLGNLADEYPAYFQSRRRLDLAREANLADDIRRVIEFQLRLPVTHIIAPNIMISKSFDSRETAIAIDFLANVDQVVAGLAVDRPVLMTLAVSREALLDRSQLNEFLTEITGIGSNVAGFYVLIAASNTEARNEIFHSDVVAGWMLMNYALKMNSYMVVNGYSDILSPFLQVTGADAGATGWWSNLRTFSLARFNPGSSGGRLPIPRYLSVALLNRVTFAELNIMRNLFPEVLNGLSSDDLYPIESGSEPQRNQEIHQTWDAIKRLSSSTDAGDERQRLDICIAMIRNARRLYQEIEAEMSLDPKSTDEHLSALLEGLRIFNEASELGVSFE